MSHPSVSNTVIISPENNSIAAPEIYFQLIVIIPDRLLPYGNGWINNVVFRDPVNRLYLLSKANVRFAFNIQPCYGAAQQCLVSFHELP